MFKNILNRFNYKSLFTITSLHIFIFLCLITTLIFISQKLIPFLFLIILSLIQTTNLKRITYAAFTLVTTYTIYILFFGKSYSTIFDFFLNKKNVPDITINSEIFTTNPFIYKNYLIVSLYTHTDHNHNRTTKFVEETKNPASKVYTNENLIKYYEKFYIDENKINNQTFMFVINDSEEIFNVFYKDDTDMKLIFNDKEILGEIKSKAVELFKKNNGDEEYYKMMIGLKLDEKDVIWFDMENGMCQKTKCGVYFARVFNLKTSDFLYKKYEIYDHKNMSIVNLQLEKKMSLSLTNEIYKMPN